MHDDDDQHAACRRHNVLTPRCCRALIRFQAVLFALTLMAAGPALGDSTAPQEPIVYKNIAGDNGYDIGIIIDNRDNADTFAAQRDVDAIEAMMRQHMLAEHIVTLAQPSLDIICDIFGGCPHEARHLWPPLLAQVVHRQKSRLYVYYLGPGRIEGVQRQLLFRTNDRTKSRPNQPYAVGWLHKQLEKTLPKSSLVLMETSFAPRALPCASEDPQLINGTLETVHRNYVGLMRGRTLPSGMAELSATQPGLATHCDRFELTADGVERPIFTKFLLKGIVDGEADQDPFGDENGKIDLGELADYVKDRIERAIQFEWGRSQMVWQIGSYGFRLANVRASNPVQVLAEPTEAVPQSATPSNDTETDPSWCERNPHDEACHRCDQDPTGRACQTYCDLHPEQFLCTEVCVDQAISEACPCTVDDPRADCARSWCQWSANELGTGVSSTFELLGFDRREACDWVRRDASESSWFLQVLSPIGIKLFWARIEETTTCSLNCDSPPPQAEQPQPARQQPAQPDTTSPPEPEAVTAIEPVEHEPPPPEPTEQPRRKKEETPLVIEERTALHNEICDDLDEPVPPYISLPRWMPGTLIISEALRLSWGCVPPVVDAAKENVKRFPHIEEKPPLPVWRQRPFATPPPTTLPVPIAMPPPVALPPIDRSRQFKPSVSQVRWLQSALTIMDFDPGPIDGHIGEKTKEALERWREAYPVVGNVTGDLNKDEFDLIIKQYGERFDRVLPSASIY